MVDSSKYSYVRFGEGGTFNVEEFMGFVMDLEMESDKIDVFNLFTRLKLNKTHLLSQSSFWNILRNQSYKEIKQFIHNQTFDYKYEPFNTFNFIKSTKSLSYKL